MAVLDVATTVDNVRTMLSNIAWWQTITETASAADAAEFIHRFAVDDEDLSRTPFILLNVEDFTIQGQPSRFDGPLAVECTLVLEVPSVNRTNISTQAQWFWQQLSALLAGIATNKNADGGLMWESIDMATPPGPVEDDDNVGLIEWLVTLRLNIHVE
jgi:hypothetical protein